MSSEQGEAADDGSGAGNQLSSAQVRALFDILTHYQTYAEITSFKKPEAITSYGFPFKKSLASSTTPLDTAPVTPRVRTPVSFLMSSVARKQSPLPSKRAQQEDEQEDKDDDGQASSTSPILQMLLTKMVLPFPGMGDIPRSFWSIRVQSIMSRLGAAHLSESYDKGALGTRKTLATGSSAVIEMIGRGMLGGVEKQEPGAMDDAKYDDGCADDLERAWGNVIQGLVYGDLVDQLFDHFVHSDDLETLSLTVEVSVRHNIFHIATLVHQIFILSPEGQYLLKLLENVHSLIPYKVIKQTLRIGNAATMISGMMRVLLAKLSVTSVTNWFGITQNADDGMNLLQRIISLVLSWDAGEFRKSAERVEKAKDRPDEDMLRTIREYIQESAESEYDTVRKASEQNSQSIITAIFNATSPALNGRLTKSQHEQCLAYYSALLSVRDRDCITDALCRQPPDMFTRSIKDVVAAYEPMIRTVHSSIDLREHFEALQVFIDDFIKTSKPSKSEDSAEDKTASVEDFVDLLMKHRRLLYKWIHALASQCPELWEDFRQWGKDMIIKFRKPASKDASQDVPSTLNRLVNALEQDGRAKVLKAIDAHVEYLDTVNALSHARLQYLVTATDSSGGTTGGPGVYLDRWQALLDETPITPSRPKGRVRRGKDVKHTTTMGKTGLEGKTLARHAGSGGVAAPNVGIVVDALGLRFRDEVRKLASSI